MNSGATAERVYDALKRRLMTHAFRPGHRLDPAALAVPLSSSVTPVRDALHMLVGETLVETHSGTGFYMPMLDEPLLEDLYAWSAELVALALRAWPRAAGASSVSAEQGRPDIADRAGAVFYAIGQRSPNGEHARAIARLSTRLHAVRTVEPQVLEAIDEELGNLETALSGSDRDMLRRLSNAYHRRRQRAAAAIVRAVYRTG
ncbi:GntR family transcriptional regulator [Sphingomonas koreensis]|nr:GntR family transcriptional regulator [Sphingomonas koreensis]